MAAGEALPAEVADWEPAGALVAGPTGLEGIEAMVTGAAGWLARPGSLVVELAPHQAERGGRAWPARPGFDDVAVTDDFAGRPRVLVGRFTG